MIFITILLIFALRAGVVKLVDTLDLGSSASRHGGSSPFTRTKTFAYGKGFFNIKTIHLILMLYL